MHGERRRSHSRLHGSNLTGGRGTRDHDVDSAGEAHTSRGHGGDTDGSARLEHGESRGCSGIVPALGTGWCLPRRVTSAGAFWIQSSSCQLLEVSLAQKMHQISWGQEQGLALPHIRWFCPFFGKKKWPPPGVTLLVLCVLNPDLWGGWF